MTKTSDMFKFFSVRPPEVETVPAPILKQVWKLFYRDQDVYFGSNTPPVIEQAEKSIQLDHNLRNKSITQIIEEGKWKYQILDFEEFKLKFPTARDRTLGWLQTNAATCTITELKTFITQTIEIGKIDANFVNEYYSVAEKHLLWDTLYAEMVSPSVDEYKRFRERIEATIIISEIMERHGSLTDGDILLHTILDEVSFEFPPYLLKEEVFDTYILLYKLNKISNKINNEINRQAREQNRNKKFKVILQTSPQQNESPPSS